MLSWQLIALGLVLVGLAAGGQQLRVNHWQTAAARAEQAKADCKADLAEAQRGIRELSREIERQNEHVQSLEERASALADQAALAALRISRQAQGEHRAIDQAGAGPTEMNQWLLRTFGPE